MKIPGGTTSTTNNHPISSIEKKRIRERLHKNKIKSISELIKDQVHIVGVPAEL